MEKSLLDLGIEKEICHQSCKILSHLLANEYVLYLTTVNFHWNITGENFISLHKLLESHYEWLKESADSLAERIRALGEAAPASYKRFHEETSLKEAIEELTAHEMISTLVERHAKQIRELRQAIKELNDTNDYATADLLIKVLGDHEQKVWMLRSHLIKYPAE